MTAMPCPFCGIVTEVPHETQEGCIDALHREIARVREILDHSTPLRSEPGSLRRSADEQKPS
jgi:hypothetical protein